ncbi:MAG TPA: dihydrodipicolinate synthase family protein [Actinopolymorphaceae bacterium]
MVELPPDGVSVALITPMTPEGEVDHDAVGVLVGRAIEGGVTGLSPAGSTGEGARLSRAQRRSLVRQVVSLSAGLPVLAGVPFLAPDDALAEIAELAEDGAQAAMVSPPGYYSLTDDEIISLFGELANRSPLPLVLYHVPGMARIGFSPAVVSRLAEHPRIVGLKDSGRDLEYLRTVVRGTATSDFRVVTGADTLLPESLAAGAVGAIAASPNVAPSLAPGLYAAAVAGKHAVIAARRDQLLDLVSACRGVGFPAGWKAAAALADACGLLPVPPGRPVDAAGLDRLRPVVEEVLGFLAPVRQ